MDNTKALTALEERFRRECVKYDIERMYPKHVGEEDTAIVTSLTQEELEVRFADLIPSFGKYVLMTPEMNEPIRIFDRNNGKYDKNQTRHGVSVEYNDALQTSSFQVPDVGEEYEKTEINIELHRCIAKLHPSQQRKVYKHFFENMTEKEIAVEEGVSIQTVNASLYRAKISLRKMLAPSYMEVFK